MLEFDIQDKLILVSCDSHEMGYLSRYSNRFRLVFIVEGNGTAILGEESYRYEKDSFFLMAPRQELDCISPQKTRLLVIIFGLFRSSNNKSDEQVTSFTHLYQHIQQISQAKNIIQGMRISDETDRDSVARLVPLLRNELAHPQGYSKEIAINVVFILLNILTRNIDNASGGAVSEYDPETNRVLNYIKDLVQQNNRFTIRDVAKGLNMSDYNLNKIVIKGTGKTLKSLITKYQVELFAEP